MKIGDWIRRERKSAGWSQQRLADRANVSRVTVAYIETGKVKNPHDETVDAIWRVFEEVKHAKRRTDRG